MALPSPPIARIGLPSNPAPRSRSLSARTPRREIPPRPASSASDERPRARVEPLPPLPNTFRIQLSLNDLSSTTASRSIRVPPALPALNSLPAFPTRDGAPESRKSDEFITSLSSAASCSQSSISSTSSLFSSHELSSSASSTSSYDDEDDASKGENGKLSQRTDGFGLSLWNRVAAAAGNLTVSVSRAIETNIVSYVGEMTPPGQDSRLTRAMKDYYISKARETSDLPDWLFEERDRGTLGRLRIANVTPEDSLQTSVVTPPPVPSFVPPLPLPADLSPAGIMINRDGDPVRSHKLSLGRKRSARVRFAEQVHPRRGTKPEMPDHVLPTPAMSSAHGNFAMVRSSAVPPVPRKNVVKLADVNVHGRRPSAQGLPSGVRPQRQITR